MVTAPVRPACATICASLTAVIGPNGAGKSSLLDALTGRVQPSTGRVRTGGLPRNRLAYMPQQSGIDRTFPLAEAAAAHDYIESRQAFGRVVLIP